MAAKLKIIGRLALSVYLLILILLRMAVPNVSNIEFTNSLDWYRGFYQNAATMQSAYFSMVPNPSLFIQNLVFIIYMYRAFDILIFILILFGNRLGMFLLFTQTLVLMFLQSLDTNSSFNSIFNVIG